VPIDLVDPNPFQARRDFDPAEIQSLAASIRDEGLLQPPLARRVEAPPAKGQTSHDFCYQLALGERRLRACKLLGWKTIPLTVLELSDADMRRKGAAENAQRKDLDPIERAREWKALLDAGDYASQAALGAALGVEQGTVSNAIRLLELPKAWIDRIISREIPPTHARWLLPYKEFPKILANVEKRIGTGPYEGSRDAFRDDVAHAVRSASKPLEGEEWTQCRNFYGNVPIFTPGDEQRRQLGVIEMEGYRGKELRALNMKLWRRLQATHAAAWIKKHGGDGRKKPAAAGEKPKKLTAAEELARAKANAEQLGRRIGAFRADWLRYLIAEKLPTAGMVNLLRILLYAPLRSTAAVHVKDEHLAASLRAAGATVKAGYGRPGLWPGLTSLAASHFEDLSRGSLLVSYAASYFWQPGPDGGHPVESMLPGDVEAIAGSLQIDLDAAWRHGQAGPLSARWWNLFTKEELVEQARALRAYVDPAKPKSVMVKVLLAIKPCPLPKEMKKLKVAK
jgi:ParB/RepB/Spo0J family partition protein